jgi:hypothetical protein
MKNGLGRIPKSLSLLNQKKEKPSQNIINKVEQVDLDQKSSLSNGNGIGQPKKTTQKGLPAGWTRATFIIEEKMNEKIKALAYWERLTVKEIMYEALREYLKGKQVKPIPQKRIIIHN